VKLFCNDCVGAVIASLRCKIFKSEISPTENSLEVLGKNSFHWISMC